LVVRRQEQQALIVDEGNPDVFKPSSPSEDVSSKSRIRREVDQRIYQSSRAKMQLVAPVSTFVTTSIVWPRIDNDTGTSMPLALLS
jgi:hypothetical protein